MQPSNGISTLPEFLAEVLRIAREFRAAAAAPADIEAPWFRGVNDRQFDLIPGAYWRANIDESALLIDFKDQAPPYFGNGGERHSMPTDPWQWYFLMQHYGLPTRLLDWTENALIGLFFSLYNPGPRPCVWVLDPAQLNKASLGEACVISPGGEFSQHWLPYASEDQTVGCRQNQVEKFQYKGKDYSNAEPLAIFAPRRNARIVAQQGTFTVHGADTVALNQQFQVGRTPLSRIDVEANARDTLLADLELCGISEFRQFPELDKLAVSIKQRFGVRP